MLNGNGESEPLFFFFNEYQCFYFFPPTVSVEKSDPFFFKKKYTMTGIYHYAVLSHSVVSDSLQPHGL